MSRPSRSTVKSVQVKHESTDSEDEEEQPLEQRRKMHTFNERETGNGGSGGGAGGGGGGVPAFLAKLWRLVDDTETDNLICWSKDGRSFIIQNQAQFARELLPLNYKHNNMASFIRQLNMYGFHKITSIDNGGLRFDRDEIEFSHPCFKRNYPYLLDHIKRKISNTKTVDEKSVLKQETVSKVLSDVKAMRGRQDNLDSRFSVMKQENEALWREIASLRQKHAKQQQIVNKLIQFLISIVQPSRNMSGVKRHMQLMINDTPENARTRTTSETESECGGGPVIHELSEELLDEVMNPHHEPGTASPYQESVVERPRSNLSVSSSHNYDYSNQSGEDLLQMAGNGGVNPLNYIVIEAPDSQQQQDLPQSPLCTEQEQNVLTTPMVREQEERKRLQLKEKNKQRRREDLEISPKSSKTMPQPLLVKQEPDLNPGVAVLMQPSNEDLYNVNFINSDMPTDLFEDSSLLQSNPEEAAQFGLSTVNSGKFAQNPALIDANLASTSKAAAAEQMALAKYTGGENGQEAATATGPSNGHLMRVNSVDEVHGHLDNLQDELDTLKDLLRTDGVSIDQNMLLGLFNDSELLDNYGLSFPTDSLSGSDKKVSSGSQLMAYQPSMYDLSDILDTDPDNKNPQQQNGRQLQTQSSVLNTPRHES